VQVADVLLDDILAGTLRHVEPLLLGARPCGSEVRPRGEGQVTRSAAGRRVRVASFLKRARSNAPNTGALVAKGEPNSATIAMPGAHGKVEFADASGLKKG